MLSATSGYCEIVRMSQCDVSCVALNTGLRSLDCEPCRNEIVLSAARTLNKSARKRTSASVIAFGAYDCVCNNILAGEHIPRLMLEDAFCGACALCDNTRATIAFAAFSRESACDDAAVELLLRRGVTATCDYCDDCEDAIAFIANCFFAGASGEIWKSLDFYTIFNDRGRADIIKFLKHGGMAWATYGQWAAHRASE